MIKIIGLIRDIILKSLIIITTKIRLMRAVRIE